MTAFEPEVEEEEDPWECPYCYAENEPDNYLCWQCDEIGN